MSRSPISSLPIGVFDSGLGGLTVLKQIAKVLPNEDLIYLGDNARVPYGNRSKETIIKFSLENANFLLSKKVKCIVIACNTASSFAGDELKNKLKIPVFDVISPAAIDALKLSKIGIGVIGTRGTIGSGVYQVKLKNENSKLKIVATACPLFVPFIEEGELDNSALKIVAKEYLSEFKSDKIDTLILGCTHYPIIKNLIQKTIGDNIKIIDPGMSVAMEVKNYLKNSGMLNVKKDNGLKKYYVTDYTERFIKVAEMFLGHEIENNLENVKL